MPSDRPHAQPLTDDAAIGWYVHLPFCTTKCGYCDFYSLPTVPGLVDGLVAALNREMALRDPGRPVDSLFIGGGTPTVLPAKALAAILDAVRSRTGPVTEFTVEANPSSANELKLDLLRERGVNRLSFGAQSFDPDELAILERLHDPGQIEASVRLARRAGFDNINLDLIYAIPGQTPAKWQATLRRAIALDPEHLSCYALMYEPQTALTRRLHAGRITPCDEALEAEMFALTREMLAAAGYKQYEISNFARPGRPCRANVIYWMNRPYVGFGPSAVSYVNGERRRNVPDVRRYVEMMASDPEAVVVERERLGPRARAGETAIQMLRLTAGMNCAAFERQTGFDPAVLFAVAIERHGRAGLLEQTAVAIRLTERGQLLANRVMMDFLLEESPRPARTVALRVEPRVAPVGSVMPRS